MALDVAVEKRIHVDDPNNFVEVLFLVFGFCFPACLIMFYLLLSSMNCISSFSSLLLCMLWKPSDMLLLFIDRNLKLFSYENTI